MLRLSSKSFHTFICHPDGITLWLHFCFANTDVTLINLLSRGNNPVLWTRDLDEPMNRRRETTCLSCKNQAIGLNLANSLMSFIYYSPFIRELIVRSYY